MSGEVTTCIGTRPSAGRTIGVISADRPTAMSSRTDERKFAQQLDQQLERGLGVAGGSAGRGWPAAAADRSGRARSPDRSRAPGSASRPARIDGAMRMPDTGGNGHCAGAFEDQLGDVGGRLGGNIVLGAAVEFLEVGRLVHQRAHQRHRDRDELAGAGRPGRRR